MRHATLGQNTCAKIKVRIHLLLLTLASGLLAAGPGLAKEGDAPASYTLSNPLKASTPPELIGRVILIFTGVVGSFAMLMFIYGGLTLLTSRGNPEQIQKGRNIFTWAVIGLVVVFTSYVVLRNVLRVIGASD